MQLKPGKKAIFLDLDGTIIDHKSYTISPLTKEAIASAQKNGHLIVLATGRPPSLFYGIPEQLGLETIIAANGRYVNHEGTVLYEAVIDPVLLDAFVQYVKTLGIDVAFISGDGYAMEDHKTDLPEKFSKNFNLEIPSVIKDFHKNHNVLQMVMFYDGNDLNAFKEAFPQLDFNVSCEYGIDINYQKGMKDIGIKKIIEHLGIKQEDTIAIGDGFNDKSMIEYAGIGVAMGNAYDPVKKAADMVTKPVNQDGIHHAFKVLGIIK